jgi:hypothetical protein
MQLLTVTVEARDVIRALDQLGASAERLVKAAARDTAERIADEARARVARRTGRTARGILVEETRDGRGLVACVKRLAGPDHIRLQHRVMSHDCIIPAWGQA